MKVKKSNRNWEDLPEVITPIDYAEVMGIGENKAREFFKSKGFPRVPGTGIKQLGYRDLVKRFSEGKPLEEKIDNLHLSDALAEIWNLISRTNKYIDETAPWLLAKEEDKQEKLKSVMYHLSENLRKVAILISPFMEDTATSIFKQLGLTADELQAWDSLYEYDKIPNNTKVIEKGEPLFVRLDMEEEVNYIKEQMKGK